MKKKGKNPLSGIEEWVSVLEEMGFKRTQHRQHFGYYKMLNKNIRIIVFLPIKANDAYANVTIEVKQIKEYIEVFEKEVGTVKSMKKIVTNAYDWEDDIENCAKLHVEYRQALRDYREEYDELGKNLYPDPNEADGYEGEEEDDEDEEELEGAEVKKPLRRKTKKRK